MRYGRVLCPEVRSTTSFFITLAVSYELGLVVFPNLQMVNLVYSLTLWKPFSHCNATDVKKTISEAINFDFDVGHLPCSPSEKRFTTFKNTCTI